MRVPTFGLVVRVIPDVPAIDRTFDYLVPEGWEDRAVVGAVVRIPLHGRRVGGWIEAVGVEPPEGVRLAPLAKISGAGPSGEMIDLCRWAAWRWSGRLATFLGLASPDRVVGRVASRWRRDPGAAALPPDRPPRVIRRIAPATSTDAIVLDACTLGDTLVVCPSVGQAAALARRLRAAGIPTALHPDDWARAAAGGVTVVGARSAAFAPMPRLAAAVVLDEHDEALQSEGSPTWHAREVVLERARRARVPVTMTSPVPSLESMARSPLVVPDRAEERAGWAPLVVVDRRDDDVGRSGLYSPSIVPHLRSDAPVVCVLNRVGRAQLLACRVCRSLLRCEQCDGPMAQHVEGVLRCRRCETDRPVVCQACGGTTVALLRQGVTRAREELEALVGEPVSEIGEHRPATRVSIGTEAALHRVRTAGVVVFLEFDQELFAPRYRAAEQALGLLARASRVVGGRLGTVVVQTRAPEHEVIRAALHADPSIVADADAVRRRLTRFPPAVTMAVVGGQAAPGFMQAFGAPLGVDVMARGDDEWILVADDRKVLLDALAATPRPPGRLRLQIDPMRLR